MFFKKSYDLIFSLGEACSCSSTLRRANLQIRSFPFDWLFGSTLLGRVNILVNNFENLISLEELEYQGNNGIPTHLCDIYKSKSNGLGFNHDFLSGVNPKDVIEEISAKYERRAKRLLQIAQNSKKNLIVWLDSPGANWHCKNNDDFVEGYKILQAKFPDAQVELLVIAWESGLDFRNRKKEKLGNFITKYTFDYQLKRRKKHVADFAVDEKLLLKIFKNYKLNMSFRDKIETFKRKFTK